MMIRGLLLKDFLVLKKYARMALLMIAVFIAISLMSRDNLSMGSMVTLFATMMVINAFAYDDHAKWNRYMAGLPFPRKTGVMARYLLGFGLFAAGVVINLGLVLVHQIYWAYSLGASNMLLILSLGFVMLVMLAIELPLLYQFGSEKGRMLMILVLALPAAMIGVAMNGMAFEAITRWIYLLPPVALLLYGISYFISVGIVEKKEY